MIAAEFRGGPLHMDRRGVEYDTVSVAMTTRAELISDHDESADRPFRVGFYRARRNDKGEMVTLMNGFVPFDFEAPQ